MQYKLIANSLNDTYRPIETVLLNRGVNDYKHYLQLTENDIESWENLDNINEAVKCFDEHFERRDEIAILVDSDP